MPTATFDPAGYFLCAGNHKDIANKNTINSNRYKIINKINIL